MLTSGELGFLRSDYEAHFNDECVILSYGQSLNSLNEPVPAYSTGTATPCGYDASGGSKLRKPEQIAMEVDAIVRFPVGTSLGAKDLIKITKQYGTAITPITLEIESQQRGSSGLLVMLKRFES